MGGERDPHLRSHVPPERIETYRVGLTRYKNLQRKLFAFHDRLLDEIRDTMDDYEVNSCYNDSDFANHLERWFINHLKNLGAHLHKHPGT